MTWEPHCFYRPTDPILDYGLHIDWRHIIRYVGRYTFRVDSVSYQTFITAATGKSVMQ